MLTYHPFNNHVSAFITIVNSPPEPPCISHHYHQAGPRHNITLRERFISKSCNVVYCISCRLCPALYIEETGRILREYTGEHLPIMTRIPPVLPVEEHFNRPRHRLDDMGARCVKQCRGTNNTRRRDKMCLIFIFAPLSRTD